MMATARAPAGRKEGREGGREEWVGGEGIGVAGLLGDEGSGGREERTKEEEEEH